MKTETSTGSSTDQGQNTSEANSTDANLIRLFQSIVQTASQSRQSHASVEGHWNSNNPSYPDPIGDHPDADYGTQIRYKPLGQYGNGYIRDFSANYNGLTEDDRENVLDDPTGFSESRIDTQTEKVDPDDVIGPVSSENEIGEVDADTTRHVGQILSAVGPSLGADNAVKATNDLKSWAQSAGQGAGPGTRLKLLNAIGTMSNLGGAMFSFAGALMNLLGSSHVYTGQAVDNAENANAFTNNIATFGSVAETGERTLNNQAELMNRMADRLTEKDGTFDDAEYAMKTVNQLSRLAGGDPIFILQNHRSLPEMTTGDGEADIPLPADVFAVGAAQHQRRDSATALVNESNDSTTIDTVGQANDRDAQAGKNIADNWQSDADNFVDSANYTDAHARETGMLRMANQYDGQLQKTGEALNHWNEARNRLFSKVKNVMDPDNFDRIARQAGPSIRQHYAAQEGVTDVDTTYPVEIGVNTKAGVKSQSAAAWNVYAGLSFNTRDAMQQAFRVDNDSALGGASLNMHSALVASGKELTPFKSLNDVIAKDLVRGQGYVSSFDEDTNYHKEDIGKDSRIVQDFKDITGIFPTERDGEQASLMQNILKRGFDIRLKIKGERTEGFDHSTGHTKEAISEVIHLQVDDINKNPEELFEQIQDGLVKTLNDNFPKEKNVGIDNHTRGWDFRDFQIQGVTPMRSVGSGDDIHLALGHDNDSGNDQIAIPEFSSDPFRV